MNVSPAVAAVFGALEFDPEALHERYLSERDKRVRPEGVGQYQEVAAQYSRFAEDPYADPNFSREPVTDHVDFAIIGGGFGGLLMGARLREAGFEKLRVVETGGDFGGTWYWNRYPGAMCDVESYCYLPLLEELNYIPKHKYTFAPEILEHSRRIARHYKLYDNALLQTVITGMSWDDAAKNWVITTNRNDRFTAQYVAMANGPLSVPKLPGISGITSFKGHMFHTSRWDYAYTGGDSYGNLHKLKDKRVGIIGTGATAVQCIPHLGASAQQLFVFQRTPSSIDVRNNHETDPQWAASLKPGWQLRRMENFNILVSGGEQEEDLVHDGWTDIFRNLTVTAAELASRKIGRKLTDEEREQLIELNDYRKMNQIRARVDAVVKDPKTAALLKPWYRQFCKRPCFHDQYLETYNRPNVTLVDTNGHGVDRITERGVVVNGQEYELDCLIFATGFETASAFTKRAGYDIVGRDGKTLSQHWSDGIRTLHGMTSDGFPNCFFIGRQQAAVTVNLPLSLQTQTRHITHIVTEARKRGAVTFEPSPDAVTEYVRDVRKYSTANSRFFVECTPGYYNSEGAAGNKQGFFSETYGAGSLHYFRVLAEWRDAGTLPGMVLR